MLAKICVPGTMEQVAVGEEGEICVTGPGVMLGYLDDAVATAQTLRTHADGFFYFTVRLKRMISPRGSTSIRRRLTPRWSGR